MKKALLILAFLFVAFGMNAQDKIISGYGNQGVTNATATIKIAAYNYTYLMNIPSAYVYTWQVKLSQLTADDNTATVVLKGSLDNTNYLDIDTISWAGTTVDTVITASITSSPVSYKYLRLTITPTDTARVNSIWLNALPLH
jgi:hypothetical protein